MRNAPLVNNVKVYINEQEQTEKLLDESADVLGVGHGGILLAEAMVEEVRQSVYEETYPAGTFENWLVNFDELIDIAAGTAIRDVAVRAAVLKRQLALTSDNDKRSNELAELLRNMPWIRGVSRYGKDNSVESAIFSGLDEQERLDNMVSEVQTLLQKWIELDNIEGVYSEDVTLYKAAHKKSGL